MIRVMIDTDELGKLTPHVELLATYADLVPDHKALAEKFPHSQLVLIDRGLGDPEHLASVMDVERGALSVSHIPAWLDRKEQEGVAYRTLYVNRGNLDSARQAAGHRTVYYWVATLDGTAHIDGYAPLEAPAAIQVLGASALDYHADLSLVFDEGWNHAPAPQWLHRARELSRTLTVEDKAVSAAHAEMGLLLRSAR